MVLDDLRRLATETYDGLVNVRGADEQLIFTMLVHVYRKGMNEAAEYVSGNFSDAETVAAHLEAVAAGKKPMYEE